MGESGNCFKFLPFWLGSVKEESIHVLAAPLIGRLFDALENGKRRKMKFSKAKY